MTDRRRAALDHVKKHANAGDVPSILAALDDFAINHEFLMNVGPEKGPLLEASVRDLKPGARVLELGCFCGYSAILIGNALPEGATLTGVEVHDKSVAVASSIVEFAGLADRVSIRHGSSTDVIGTLRHPFDLVFLDHWKDLYKPNLLALEAGNLLVPGSVVFADNVGLTSTRRYISSTCERPDAIRANTTARTSNTGTTKMAWRFRSSLAKDKSPPSM